jgi:GTP-binding protein EngB required for normal cell division
MQFKHSVPKHLDLENDIQTFLTQLKKNNAKQWKKLKIVFLGHGEVGKTSLLHAVQWLQDHVCSFPSISQNIFYFNIFIAPPPFFA